jgi:mannose-6-phosphate isomerase-like protein (cupin superfamily)
MVFTLLPSPRRQSITATAAIQDLQRLIAPLREGKPHEERMADASLKPLIVKERDAPAGGWDDPNRGRLTWRTLLSKGVTASETFTCGIVDIGPGEWLEPHRHAQNEIYYIVSGSAVVTLGEDEKRTEAGDAVFIPGMLRHGFRHAGEGRLRLFYAFAVDSFDEVTYLFPKEGR